MIGFLKFMYRKYRDELMLNKISKKRDKLLLRIAEGDNSQDIKSEWMTLHVQEKCIKNPAYKRLQEEIKRKNEKNKKMDS